jgi:amidase
MATVNTASEAIKQAVTLQKVQAVATFLGLEIPPSDLDDWHSLLASNQDSVDVVESLPNSLPLVDLD